MLDAIKAGEFETSAVFMQCVTMWTSLAKHEATLGAAPATIPAAAAVSMGAGSGAGAGTGGDHSDAADAPRDVDGAAVRVCALALDRILPLFQEAAIVAAGVVKRSGLDSDNEDEDEYDEEVEDELSFVLSCSIDCICQMADAAGSAGRIAMREWTRKVAPDVSAGTARVYCTLLSELSRRRARRHQKSHAAVCPDVVPGMTSIVNFHLISEPGAVLAWVEQYLKAADFGDQVVRPIDEWWDAAWPS